MEVQKEHMLDAMLQYVGTTSRSCLTGAKLLRFEWIFCEDSVIFYCFYLEIWLGDLLDSRAEID